MAVKQKHCNAHVIYLGVSGQCSYTIPRRHIKPVMTQLAMFSDDMYDLPQFRVSFNLIYYISGRQM